MPGGPEGQGYTPEDSANTEQEAAVDQSASTSSEEVPASEQPESTEGNKLKEAVASAGEKLAGLKEKVTQKKEAYSERRREKKEQREISNNLARARERRIKGYAEIIKHGARTPEELQQAMEEMSFKDFKEAQERVDYGPGAMGKLKAFLAGEKDFAVNEDGSIDDANTLKEAGRRVLSTVFNRRTAVSAGMIMALGVLTGGVGWAAGGVLMGGAAGRGIAEMGELFKGNTREAREKVLFAERARWDQMRALALEAQGSDDPVTQSKAAQELVDLMYKQGESVWVRDLMESQKNLAEKEEKFAKFRNRLQTAGELVGAAAGLTSILNGGVEHLDMDMFNKVDGQSVFHGVQQSQEGWQFLYSSGEEAGLAVQAGANILHAGQFGAHALEASTSQVLAYTIGERTVPMLLASGLAWWSEKGKKYGESAEDVAYRDRKAERLGEQIEKPAEYIRQVADEHHNPIPENPRGYSYDWNEQPKVVDEADMAKVDRWYPFKTVEIQGESHDEPYVDSNTGQIVEVGVLGVDVDNNRIAVAQFEDTLTGANHVPVKVMRLDEFLTKYHLHLNAEAGEQFSTDGSEAQEEDSEGKVSMRPQLKEDMYSATRGADRFAHEKDVLDKLRFVQKRERRIGPEGSRALRYPDGFDGMSMEEKMYWLGGLTEGVDEQALKSIGVEIGREEHNGIVERYARYIGNNGQEYILTGRQNPDQDMIRFNISNGPVGKRHHRRPASVGDVDRFIGSLLGSINEQVKTGKILLPTEPDTKPQDDLKAPESENDSGNVAEVARKEAVQPAPVEKNQQEKEEKVPIIIHTSQGRRRAPEKTVQEEANKNEFSQDLVNLLKNNGLESADELVGREPTVNLDDLDQTQATKIRRDLGLDKNEEIVFKVEKIRPTSRAGEPIRDYWVTLSHDKSETEVPLTRFFSWFRA